MRLLRLLPAALIALAPALPAQIVEGDPNDAAALFAISTTPVGALPPTVAPSLLRTSGGGAAIRGQFGYQSSDGDVSIRTFGGGVDLVLSRATLGLTAGYLDYSCGDIEELAGSGVDVDCSGAFLGGASLTAPLATLPVGAAGTSSFVIGVDGSFGFGSGDILEATASGERLSISGSSLSASLGLPLALAARGGAITFVPHLTPRFAWGRTKLTVEADTPAESDSESGTAFMLGGGVALRFIGGFGLDLGFQKVFIEDSETLIGVGVTYTLR